MSEMDNHERYRELAAIATTGDLSQEERAELEKHLAECRGCCALTDEYLLVTREGMPLVGSEAAPEVAGDAATARGAETAPVRWSEEDARAELSRRIALEEGKSAEPAQAARRERS